LQIHLYDTRVRIICQGGLTKLSPAFVNPGLDR
jgi:hypothetical protein